MADSALRISMLEQENDALRARVHELERALFESDVSLIPLGLPRREESILAALLTRLRLSREQLHAAIYAGDLDADMVDVAVVESHVSKLRKKLKAYGIEIQARRFHGYWMEPDQKEALRALLRPAQVPFPIGRVA